MTAAWAIGPPPYRSFHWGVCGLAAAPAAAKHEIAGEQAEHVHPRERLALEQHGNMILLHFDAHRLVDRDRLFDAESVLASKRTRRILRARIRRPQLPGAPGQASRPARARIAPRMPGRCNRRSSRSRSRSRSAAGARTSSTPPERPVPLFRLGRAKRKAEHVLILLVCMPWNFLAVWNLDRDQWP